MFENLELPIPVGLEIHFHRLQPVSSLQTKISKLLTELFGSGSSLVSCKPDGGFCVLTELIGRGSSLVSRKSENLIKGLTIEDSAQPAEASSHPGAPPSSNLLLASYLTAQHGIQRATC